MLGIFIGISILILVILFIVLLFCGDPFLDALVYASLGAKIFLLIIGGLTWFTCEAIPFMFAWLADYWGMPFWLVIVPATATILTYLYIRYGPVMVVRIEYTLKRTA